MKKLLQITILGLFTAISAMAQSGFPESGTCGENLTWHLDIESGVLTVSGTGDMTTFYQAPWHYMFVKQANIDDGVTSIGHSAFRDCFYLTSVSIPNSITSIGNSAFSSCRSLTSVAIPDSVTSIGISAFSYCRSLSSIDIPNSVTSIGKGAFYYCSNLTSINVDAANSHYLSMDGVLYDKDKTTLIQHPAGKTGAFSIPNSVTSIETRGFSDCSGLSSVDIPDSVESIGDYAFSGCSGLSSVTIPNSVKSIGNYAFSGCSGLTSIDISTSITSIGFQTFSYCTGLTSIDIPNSVISIGRDAFFSCTSLSSVTISSSVTDIEDSAFRCCLGLISIEVDAANFHYSSMDGVLYNKDQTTLVQYSTGKTGAFTVPNSVTSIGNRAFYYCSGLTSVDIPNSVTSIGGEAFYDCSGLTEITLRAVVPPAVKVVTFDHVNVSSITMYVPLESLEDYQNIYPWSRFNLQGVVFSAVAENTLEGISVFAQDREIIISGIEQPKVSVYDVNGRIVASGAMNRITVAKAGIYLVCVKGCAIKVPVL